MLRLAALFAAFALAACDTGVEPGPPDSGVSTGTFTALLNGEPYEAPAAYRTDDSGWFFLEAVTTDSALSPPYVQRVGFAALGPGLAEGETRSLFEESGVPTVFVSERIADGVIQSFDPVEGAPGGLRVVEADSVAGRLRVLFEGTFAAVGPRGRYQRLPDTLRFTGGEFVIDPAMGGS